MYSVKKITVVLALFFFFLTVNAENEIGCKEYPGYLLCPEPGLAVNILIDTDPMDCFEVYGEDQGCNGTATLVDDLTFEECNRKLPLSNGEIDYLRVESLCHNKTWPAGTKVVLRTFETHWECDVVESEGSYLMRSCETGSRLLVNASIFEDGDKYMAAFDSEPFTGMRIETWHIALAGIIAIAAFVLYRKRHSADN